MRGVCVVRVVGENLCTIVQTGSRVACVAQTSTFINLPCRHERFESGHKTPLSHVHKIKIVESLSHRVTILLQNSNRRGLIYPVFGLQLESAELRSQAGLGTLRGETWNHRGFILAG
jgi:hypothetical protein